mmetsp:Transcript_12300/g.36519  ORF Transcript_12300/g.36519 Transcript_12300/m.36519 type:complete len:264 (-) Transcript_12300:45-836(-)
MRHHLRQRNRRLGALLADLPQRLAAVRVVNVVRAVRHAAAILGLLLRAAAPARLVAATGAAAPALTAALAAALAVPSTAARCRGGRCRQGAGHGVQHRHAARHRAEHGRHAEHRVHRHAGHAGHAAHEGRGHGGVVHHLRHLHVHHIHRVLVHRHAGAHGAHAEVRLLRGVPALVTPAARGPLPRARRVGAAAADVHLHGRVPDAGGHHAAGGRRGRGHLRHLGRGVGDAGGEEVGSLHDAAALSRNQRKKRCRRVAAIHRVI